MRFVQPEVLWLLLALPALALGAVWGAVLRKRALQRFAGEPAHVPRFTGQVSVHRRSIKALLFVLVIGAGIVALARPQWGARLEQIERRGVDVVVVLDTSLSMATQDVAPDRLGQAKREIGSLVDRLSGDRIALVTFAGDAALSCPLTLDHEAVRLFLDGLDVESVPVPGTALASALRVAARTFGRESLQTGERNRAIILLSDGEDHQGELEDSIELLNRSGIPVYAVGVGTPRGGPIPLRSASGTLTGYKKDREERIVTSRLDERVLRELALETGGGYYRTTPSEGEIEEIAHALASMDKQEFGSTVRRRYEERFQLPLAVALLALLGESLLGDRRWNAHSPRGDRLRRSLG